MVSVPQGGEPHPNKQPFVGILLQLDQFSHVPPLGSDEQRVRISTEEAERSLHTILGMGINFAGSLRGHNRARKIGVITDAWIDGQDFVVAGHVYAIDCAPTLDLLRRWPEPLGMSFEVQCTTKDLLPGMASVHNIFFTGACVLPACAAAYRQSTFTLYP